MPLSEAEANRIHQAIVDFVRTQLQLAMGAARALVLAPVPFPLRFLVGRGYDLAAGKLEELALAAVDSTLDRLGKLTLDQVLGVIAAQQANRNNTIQGPADGD